MRCVLPFLLLFGAASAEVTASRPVAKGTILTASDLSADTAVERDAFVGLEARRPLMPGKALRSYDVQQPVAVRRQAGVTILFRRGPLTLRTEGRALGGGQVGDVVDVSISGRKRPLSAKIVAAGTVEVGA